MESNPKASRRKSIRLKGYDYSQAGGYFVTIVTLGRECLFGEVIEREMVLNPLGRMVQECWAAIPAHFPNVEVGTFIAMPNHIHGIVFIHEAGQITMANCGRARYISPLPSISPLQ